MHSFTGMSVSSQRCFQKLLFFFLHFCIVFSFDTNMGALGASGSVQAGEGDSKEAGICWALHH